MGACSSSKGDINFCSTEKKEQELKCIACACGLGKGQLKRFLTAFRKVDVDERGVIYRHEFFDFFSVAKTGFAKRAFALMDQDSDNRVDFCEYVAVIFAYCTYDRISLTRFAFDLFDVDGSGELGHDEIRRLVEFVYGGDVSLKVKRILDHLDVDGSGNVNFEEFLEYSKDYPQLLFPAFYLQEVMRTKCLGVMFWEDHTEKVSKSFRCRVRPLRNVLEEIRKSFADGETPNMENLLETGEALRGLAVKARGFVKKKSRELDEAVKRIRNHTHQRKSGKIDLSKKKDGIFIHAQKVYSWKDIRRRKKDIKEKKEARKNKDQIDCTCAKAVVKEGLKRNNIVHFATGSRQAGSIIELSSYRRSVPDQTSTGTQMSLTTVKRTVRKDPTGPQRAGLPKNYASSNSTNKKSGNMIPRAKSTPTMVPAKEPLIPQSNSTDSETISKNNQLILRKRASPIAPLIIRRENNIQTIGELPYRTSPSHMSRPALANGAFEAERKNANVLRRERSQRQYHTTFHKKTSEANSSVQDRSKIGIPLRRVRSVPSAPPQRIITVDSNISMHGEYHIQDNDGAGHRSSWDCQHCGSLNDDSSALTCVICGIRTSWGFASDSWGSTMSSVDNDTQEFDAFVDTFVDEVDEK